MRWLATIRICWMIDRVTSSRAAKLSGADLERAALPHHDHRHGLTIRVAPDAEVNPPDIRRLLRRPGLHHMANCDGADRPLLWLFLASIDKASSSS